MIRDIILHSPTAYREPATVAQATTADQVVALWLHARSRHTQRGRLDESQVVRIVIGIPRRRQRLGNQRSRSLERQLRSPK